VISRAAGDKSQFQCVTYQAFLIGFIQPLIITVILSVTFSVSSDETLNPAAGLSRLSFLERVDYVPPYDDEDYWGIGMENPIFLIPYIYNHVYLERRSWGRKLFIQSSQFGSASIAFAVLTGVGTGVLIVLQILSKFGIGPRQVVKVEGQTPQFGP
jgi:hypothetical protein